MLDGDEGAEKAAAEILAAQIHAAKIANLLQNIRSARKGKDTETMEANIAKLKVIDPENPEILIEELWVLIIKERKLSSIPIQTTWTAVSMLDQITSLA